MLPSGSGAHSLVFRFGVFQFHVSTLQLAKNGFGIRLRTQPARLLHLLLASGGKLVTRDAIRESLWEEGTTVDFEVGVNRCIRQLRAALGDDAATPRYIKTVPRLGYCFIAPVAGMPTVTAARPEFEPEAASASIAVLPFANLSGDAQDEYFSDGLAEEITNALAQIADLKVIARTSAFAFKGKNEDIRQIAATLGVSNVLEGSVRRSGEQVRVTVQLIRAEDGAHRSSKRYDRQMTDIFALQDEIAADIANQFRVRLRASKRVTRNVEAYQAYLEGRFHWHKYTPAAFEKALLCFERAVAIDGNYAEAYTGIAQCCLGQVTESGLPALDYLPKSAEAARRALELDNSDSESHAVLGQVAGMLDYDWVTAERHFIRALALNPLPYVRAAYAMWFLVPLGRPKDAVLEAERIIADDPMHLIGRLVYGASLFFAREYDRAAEACLRVLDIDASFSKVVQMLAFIRSLQGRFEESISWAEKFAQMLGHSYGGLWTLAHVYAAAGNQDAAVRTLRDLEEMQGSAQGSPTQIGMLYGLLGHRDRAFHWLQEAIRQRQPTLLLTDVRPGMDCLRDDPRFREIVEELNLSRR